MKTLRRFLARVGNLVGLGSSDLRLREEIAEHVALQTEDNLRAGMSPVVPKGTEKNELSSERRINHSPVEGRKKAMSVLPSPE